MTTGNQRESGRREARNNGLIGDSQAYKEIVERGYTDEKDAVELESANSTRDQVRMFKRFYEDEVRDV